MEKILINRLPMLTYRHLHTNETEIAFPQQAKTADAVFSSLALVRPEDHSLTPFRELPGKQGKRQRQDRPAALTYRTARSKS